MSFAVREDRNGRIVYRELEQIEEKFDRAIRHGWFEFGKELKSVANKEILRRPKGGRTYWVRGPSGRRRRHVASAAGETHANLSGTLRRSISWKVHGHDSMTFGYGVSTSGRDAAPVYAGAIEFGFKWPNREIEARPSLANAIDVVDMTDYVDLDREFPR